MSSPAQLGWVQRPLQTPRGDAAAAYDSARQRAVVFGGVTNPILTFSRDTWEWDGHRWTLRSPEARPVYAASNAMAYDRVRERTVLFNAGNGRTWEWDGQEWVQRFPASSPGSGVGYTVMAFDEPSQRVLFFHHPTAVLWAWDGIDWTPISTSGPPRLQSALVFDPLRQRTTLVNVAGETWDWDGNAWARLPAIGPTIGTSTEYDFAFDRARGIAVLTASRGGGPFSEPTIQTWEWDGNAWLLRTAAIGGGHVLWYDEVRGRVVKFGGISAVSALPSGGMYEWDGTQWSPIGTEQEPSGGHAMAYDAARQRVVMVGQSGTAEWDGVSWSELAPPTAPAATVNLALAYDVARRTTLAFGGQVDVGRTPVNETWEWDGASWTRRTPSNSPPALARHAMAYDAARGRVVLFGGHSSASGGGRTDHTWEWDGVDWTQRNPANRPPPVNGAAMVYDAARQRVVLFGGSGAETWEWDGVDWTQRTPVNAPPPRSGHGMAYDEDRQRTVLFGGTSSSGGGLADTWEWDGSQWTLLNSPQAPGGRATALAYHAASRRMVLFGGDRPGGGYFEWLGDTWVFGTAQKAVSFAYGSGCAGARGTPRLAALGRPVFGGDLQLELLDVQHSAPAVLLLSAGQASTALGGGCELAVALPVVAVGTTATAGLARFDLSIPLDESLTGVSVFGQAVVIDPQGAWLQLAFSRGLRLIIGD